MAKLQKEVTVGAGIGILWLNKDNWDNELGFDQLAFDVPSKNIRLSLSSNIWYSVLPTITF